MAYAITLGFMIVLTYAVITVAAVNAYWLELGLVLAAIVGIAALVARADEDQPFLRAASVSLVTTLALQSLTYFQLTAGPAMARPWVLPNASLMVVSMVAISLMFAGMAGAVAVGIRNLRGR